MAPRRTPPLSIYTGTTLHGTSSGLWPLVLVNWIPMRMTLLPRLQPDAAHKGWDSGALW